MRCESKVEGFHNPLSHFGNLCMRATLCDALNLAGTARYNVAIRHKLHLVDMPLSDRPKMPFAWESIPSYFNCLQLIKLNILAELLGCTVPFPDVLDLPPDNGECFFSKYLVEQDDRARVYPSIALNDRCQ